MTQTPSIKPLPENPSLGHLKKQAKALKKAYLAGDPDAITRVDTFHPSAADLDEITLRDAQVTVAREYGFDGWHQLNQEVGERLVEQRDLHRWFGTNLNNGTWNAIADGSVGPQSSADDRELFLYSAYASAYHWRIVGNQANAARGEHLISRAASVVGEPDVALRHARRCLEIIERNPGEVADWDAPFGYEALARAYAGLGELGRAAEARATAIELTNNVAEDGDRGVLMEELERGPWFGLDA